MQQQQQQLRMQETRCKLRLQNVAGRLPESPPNAVWFFTETLTGGGVVGGEGGAGHSF